MNQFNFRNLQLINWNGLETVIAGNSILDWVYAIGIFFISWTLLNLIKRTFLNRTKKKSFDNPLLLYGVAFFKSTRQSSLALISGLLVLSFFSQSERLNFFLHKALILVFLIQTTIWGLALLQAWLDSYAKERVISDPGITTTLGLISFLGKGLFLVFVVLIGLSNLGVNITAMVAGFGVGGIAVALAAQSILGDLFASLTIVLDKPFVVGDFIVLNEIGGTVEYIGLKTTRIRNIAGDQVIIANSDLLSSRIRNFKRMRERRVVQQIGVVYQSSTEQLKMIPNILNEAVQSVERTRFDRAHLKQFGAYSVDFELVYWILNPEYTVFADAQEAVNFKIWDAFAKNKIEFAYPTQQLFVSKQDV